MILDIQIKIVLPSVQSRNNVLTGLVNFLTSADVEFQHSFQIEAVFGYESDNTLLSPSNSSYITSWLPSVTFGSGVRTQEKALPWNHVQDSRRNQKLQIKQYHEENPQNSNAPTRVVLSQQISGTEVAKTCNHAENSVRNLTLAPPVLPQWVNDSITKIENSEIRLCESGVGGTYFVTDNDSKWPILAVFKPVDEEPGAPNSPKKNPSSFVPMIEWGSGGNREVAAYKLDKGFAGVPETHFVEVTRKTDGLVKKGSLQQFIMNDGDCSDVGASKFSVEDIHRLGIFDVRILNMDRNDENLLVKKMNEKEWKLIPIDHTYAFPNKIDSYFNWQYWSQTKKPFSSENLNYISSIDVISDAMMLLSTGIDEESVRNVIGSTLLLQHAANRGFNLFQIATMVSGKQNDLAKIIANATFAETNSNTTPEEKCNLFKMVLEKLIVEHLETKAMK